MDPLDLMLAAPLGLGLVLGALATLAAQAGARWARRTFFTPARGAR